MINAVAIAAMLDVPKGDPILKREVVLEIKFAEARNWMRSRGIRQLGTEHERQSKDSSADSAGRLEDRL